MLPIGLIPSMRPVSRRRIGVGEVGSAQLQPGGDAFEENAALFYGQAAGGGYDDGKLLVAKSEHGLNLPTQGGY
jgi:hypothetical protein